MFTYDQLESFVAVAEELHFGRAAERLSLTQPPLSRRIKQLEDQLHVRLFERTHRTVRLTPAGRVFLADARRLLRMSRYAALSAQRTAQGESGVVGLGFTATTAYSFLQQVLRRTSTDLPSVDLVLHEMVTASQLEALLAGSIDVGMIRPPAEVGDVRTELLFDEPVLAALPEQHPLATQHRDPAVRDFHGEPFVMYSPSEAAYFHETLMSLFRTARTQPRYVQYLSQVHSILALVRAGLGSALVPSAATTLNYQGLVFRSVRDVDPRPVKLHMAWRAGNNNPALGNVLNTIRAAARDPGPTAT